ncbi:MAG: hypothetical protein ACJ8F5_00535, partial [Bacillales bacterium]
QEDSAILLSSNLFNDSTYLFSLIPKGCRSSYEGAIPPNWVGIPPNFLFIPPNLDFIPPTPVFIPPKLNMFPPNYFLVTFFMIALYLVL